MGSDYPCQLSLTALTWEKVTNGGIALPSHQKLVTPSYAKALTTISELALVCGLSLSDVLRADYSGQESLAPYAPAEAFSFQTVDREELNYSIIEKGLRESGPDWLGRYYHGYGMPVKIELYLSRCRRAAEFLDVSTRSLVEVVWTHEAAHFVSHIGIGGYLHSNWNSFSTASSDNKEYIAQVACWGLFSVFARSELIGVMERLATHQSAKYNTWREFETKCRGKTPLDIIAELTLDVGSLSGRKPIHGHEDLHTDWPPG
jgi:hypothetical protein